jgi:hypothetical protein
MSTIFDQHNDKYSYNNTSHKQPTLEFKAQPKQLFGSLSLAFVLPVVAHGDTASFPW